jgi:uncharacterized Ntn-hydrolase superfamily protein
VVKLLPVLFLAACATARDVEPACATFSIIARDPDTGEIGIAVQSKVPAVGAVVPWAKAGVGAVATQSYANPRYGPEGLELLSKGVDPAEALKRLTEGDPERERRQVGILDAKGRTATFSGKACHAWAGGSAEDNVCAQGNILAGEDVVAAMLKAFKESKGELGARLIAALEAGQAAGGDVRGQQSAALLIVREGWGYGGLNDRYRDLRVDDHPEPIAELKRVYDVHRGLFKPREK